jgi:hypothetical protein
MEKAYDDKMLDVTGVKHLQIEIRADGRVVWINTEEGCIFRACQVEQVELVDNRDPADTDEPPYDPNCGGCRVLEHCPVHNPEVWG